MIPGRIRPETIRGLLFRNSPSVVTSAERDNGAPQTLKGAPKMTRSARSLPASSREWRWAVKPLSEIGERIPN